MISSPVQRSGPIDLDMVRKVAREVFVPFTVGGGIRSLEDMFQVLKAGAEKISIDSMAVRNPQIIQQGAKAFGRQCMVLSMQVKRVARSETIPSGYEIAIDGARVFTGMDAVEWARQGEALGAGGDLASIPSTTMGRTRGMIWRSRSLFPTL